MVLDSILLSLVFLNMKPLSVEMACLLGIQNKTQAVCDAVFLYIVMFAIQRQAFV